MKMSSLFFCIWGARLNLHAYLDHQGSEQQSGSQDTLYEDILNAFPPKFHKDDCVAQLHEIK